MDNANTDGSDAELIAEIRRSLGTQSHEGTFKAPATTSMETVGEIPEQPAYQIADPALLMADQLLGENAPKSGASAFVPGLELAVVVEGSRFRVPPGGVDLGRGSDAGGIEIADPRVSRRHARFVLQNGELAVVDLGSTNGTVILRGGERFPVESEPIQLVEGDRVVTWNDVLLAEVVAVLSG